MSHLHTPLALSCDAMQHMAAQLARCLRSGDVVALKGQVGAGKTTFARALIQAITREKIEVTSPTFTLMQSYIVQVQGKAETLWHLDLYRLENAHELQALGLDELLAHIVLIEWPEIAAKNLPESTLYIEIAFGDNSETRHLTFSGNTSWKARLKEVINA